MSQEAPPVRKIARGSITKALEEWQEDHGKDETVQELISKLDVMSMNW